MKPRILPVLLTVFFLIVVLPTVSETLFAEGPIVKQVTLNAGNKFQTIDGFGANVNPDQWRNGNLKPALDLLVDEMGGTLFRFDCFGLADWLDPTRRDNSGHFPEAYLREVYTRQDFKDAWETYRYLQSKGAKLFLNVSGRIAASLAGPDGRTLTDFDGYAEMVVSHAKWARQREHLKFTQLSPFNETDLGFPEGPRILPEDAAKVIRAILKKLDEAGMNDVKLIVMDDAGSGLYSYLDALLTQTDLVNRIGVFASHTYGNGGDEDGSGWFLEESRFAKALSRIKATAFRDRPLWVTEYGDLDQTGEVEFGIAWRSTRRLLKFLRDGASAGLVWDAYDNHHKHDGAWATYGLLKTDQSNWKYTPKRRFYAAKQVFRFVKPGFNRVEIVGPPPDPADVFSMWHAPLKHLLMLAFASPDGKDCTVVGMSTVENDLELNVSLEGLAPEASTKPFSYYRTSRNEDCVKAGESKVQGGILKAVIKENSIFTLTTLR